MYPGTIFNWHDQSAISTQPIADVDNSPLYLLASSFNRGPEKITEVSGQTFYNLYGQTMDFDKHGQPAIQAANMIDNGARLLVKRLVANDAKLANLIAVATVKRQISAIKTDSSDPSGKTIDELLGNEPVVKQFADELTITSVVGENDNTTVLTVSPAITTGNKYFWQANENDTMPELDTVIKEAEYVAWDGESEISVVRDTKIRVVEVDATDKIKKCGIILAYSKVPHPTKSSSNPVAPSTLPGLVNGAQSREGQEIGNTIITIADAITSGDEYFYSATQNMPSAEGQIYDPADADFIANWTRFGTDQTKEITVEDETELVFVEFRGREDSKIEAVKGFSIVTCSKLPADTGEESSIDPIIPNEDKYTDATSSCVIQWNAISVENCASIDHVKEVAESLFVIGDPVIIHNDTDTGVIINISADYPLICMADNGRGLSNKSFKITPDYTVSKDMSAMYYIISIFDGTTRLERCTVTLNPESTYNGKLYGINQDTAVQLEFFNVEGVFEAYVEELSDITGIDIATLNKCDLINATTNRKVPIDGITVDLEEVDFGAAYGVNLDNGTNGEFGDAPFGTEAYEEQAVAFFKGEFDDSIWDVDTYKIAAIFDANYSVKIKEAIAKFVIFREDCVFFRDYGLNVDSYNAIISYYNGEISDEFKNKFIADYYTTYQIYNPETKKRIKVTMMYDLAAVMVKHFANGCCRPVAGVANDMILPSAIEGTINFTPRITPDFNQKAELDSARINYAIFENGVCVVQSTYSSQKDFTQLSFINNVLAVQEVIRAVRETCPKSRYTFTTGSDFSIYADRVNQVLNNFQSNFAELTFDYEQDSMMAAQKIFYASLYFRFNNWAQTEVFDIYALPNE